MSKKQQKRAQATDARAAADRANADQADETLKPKELDLSGLQRPGEQGVSLEQLSGAFAGLLTTGTDPYDEPNSAVDEAGQPLRGPAEQGEPVEVCPRSILEAMLFVGHPTNEPLTSRQVASYMRGVRPAEIDELVNELNARYTADGCPYEIVSSGAGFRLALREQFARLREKMHGRSREVTLSQAAIEALAIVAYNQPVTRDDVNKLRGQASGSILAQLVRRQLLRLERPNEKPRTPRYFTTDRFLQLFGIRSLEDLPRSDDELDKQ
jgi:segregation and condensation protein B